MVRDPEHVATVNREIRDALSGEAIRVIDWTQSNDSFFAAVQVEQNVMFLILTLIILVAAFNVVSLADHDGEGQDTRYRGLAHLGSGVAARSCGFS